MKIRFGVTRSWVRVISKFITVILNFCLYFSIFKEQRKCMVCQIRDSVRSVIFWGFMQRVKAIPYRRFGKTYQSLL